MKRINEVLGPLPVDPEDFTDPCYPNENDEHVYIAHAINNIDALADALADLITSCRARGDNILACSYAEDALNAYRGAK